MSSSDSSPPWLGICCQLAYHLRPLPREGSFSSSFQSLVVGGQQLVRAWQREGSQGSNGGEAASCLRAVGWGQRLGRVQPP